MDFNNLIGNSKIKEYLTNVALTNQNLHSYIFSGREGIGKNYLPLILLKCFYVFQKVNHVIVANHVLALKVEITPILC